jgi:predicted phage terminase large subunit-like protein
MNSKQIYETIDKILTILENNFRYNYGKKITYDEIYEMMQDLYSLFNNFEKNTEVCGEIAVKRYIPLLDLLIKIDTNKNHFIEYEKQLKYAYKLGARVSLEHYFVYREWDVPEKDKFFAPRFPAICGYIHFLQEIVLNPKFTDLIFNAPAGFGKTFPEKITEAWSYGIDPTGAILSLCSNDTVVKNGSSLVRQEMKSDWFGEVFPKMKWDKEDKDYFLKETDGDWKLRDCKLGASYNASTCNSNVIGQRASKWIHLDDLYKGYKEAMNQQLNIEFYNDCQLSWRTRYILGAIPKMVITGTLWASGDFIDLEIKLLEKEHTFKKHPKYPYTRISEDGTCAIIQLPALDEYGNSVFPELKSTEELLKIKNRIEEYLWENNYMQHSTDPEELIFSYGRLRTYDTIPETDYKSAYAVIDANRKRGKDFFAMPIFKKVENDNVFDYYLRDCIFTRAEATKDLYDAIVDKIIEHHIIKLVIESNVTSELKQNLENKLKSRGFNFCEIIEKWNEERKETRIADASGPLKRQLVFPKREMYGINTDMGKFMSNLTTYNSTGSNENDDAPDACAMFNNEIIDGNSQPQKAEPLDFVRQFM